MMRRKVVKIFLGTTALSLAGCWYLFSDYNPMYDDEMYVDVAASIKAAQKYEELEPMARLYERIHAVSDDKYCPCADATYPAFVSHNYMAGRIYGLKLRKTYTGVGCVKYWLTHADFNMGNRNVWQASAFYFHKKVSELTESEQITLLLMLDNPSYFNPARHEERVKKAVARIERRLEE